MVADVSDCLHLVWKTYHYSPKSKRELNVIEADMDARIYSPAPVKRTRWFHMSAGLYRCSFKGRTIEV